MVLHYLDEYYIFKINLTIKGNQGTFHFTIEILGQVRKEKLAIVVDQQQKTMH